MTQTSAKPEAGDNRNLRRDVGLIGLLFASVGSIIGSGWLFGAMNAAQKAGPAAIISWSIGAVMILLIALTFAELGTMFPVSGGVVRFPHIAFGSFASYTSGWILWIACGTVAPIEVEGALQYATKYAAFTSKSTVNGDTVHTLTGLGYLTAVVLLALFVVVNYIGVRWFARVNNVLVWWKLAIITVVVIAFLVTQFHPSNFTSKGFMPNGWEGVFTAIATSGIVFSFLGFRQGIELAGETSNPRKYVPIAVIGSVILTGIIYVALQVAFIGSLNPRDFIHGWATMGFTNDFGPLAAIATAIGLGWLATLLYIDAIISPGDTGLIYTTVTSRVSYAMARNGNAPKVLAKTTNRGVPLISLFVAFVLGLIILLPFPSWQQLVGFITSATVLSFAAGPVVVAALRRSEPERERPFRVPGGDVIPLLAFVASNLIAIWSTWTINLKLFIAVLIGLVLLAILEMVYDQPVLEMRSGSWMILWLAGLALISYLAGNLDSSAILGFWWANIITVVFSVVVFYLAVHFRLSKATMTEHMDAVLAEADAEEQELGPAAS
ncbi:putative amino acid permease [Gordonia polyisoprenivorans VH2]|uniref:Putative amino acid permease n=1 Tax=Gordonia polyisoprenivorans (strain DSM 44266 / VH2) TaxID=1112204 RepID=H6N1A7_GORPV|nr:APC family permease [Gordonia polyisoprenivorans]AFA75872.1 putative amino acid permease [Gordonia polyisoprenivorans VH2]